VGTGEVGCGTELLCPQADDNKVSVCGRLYNVDDDTPIGFDSLTTEECIASGGTVTTGACAFDIKFYDALEFAGNPTGATPITPQDFFVDECGRFRAHNLNRPSLGFLGIGVDDRSAAPDDHRLTGVAFPVVSAETRNRQRAYVVTRTTDEQWTADADGGGTTLIDRGIFMSLYRIGGVPTQGVQITEGGVVEAANDYYFSDTNPLTRMTIDNSQPSTGPNGAGLKLNSALVEHSGTGGALPSGCVWESALGASIPGVLFFTSRVAVMGETECE
jgi:hypothetical protein